MLQALALAVLTLTGSVAVWHVLTLAVVLGAINAFDMPTRQSLLIHMTNKEDLLNAISLNSTTFNVARVIGPPVAGFLVAAAGEGICFLLNAASFLAVIACLLSMQLPPGATTPAPETDPPWTHLVDGFRYAGRHRAVRPVQTLMAASTMAGMPVLVLMPFFADGIFHRGAQGLGMLSGFMGLGAIAGVLVLAGRSRVAGLPEIMLSSSIMLGAAFILFAVSSWFYLSLAVVVVIGFSFFRQMASANTLVQSLIPDHYRGRIMALYAMTVVGLGPFGSLAAGLVAQRFGARITVCLGGLICIASGLWFRMSLVGVSATLEEGAGT